MPSKSAAHLSPAQVPTCCCLRTINIERFEQMEGGGGANEDGSGELAAWSLFAGSGISSRSRRVWSLFIAQRRVKTQSV